MSGGFIETKFIVDRIDYTGKELRSHFVREIGSIELDGVISFVGACDVSEDSLIDLEDYEAGDFIRAKTMLHFIGEHFGVPLKEANFRLRIFATIVKEKVEELSGKRIKRIGDDLFVSGRKLTVAIATYTGVSSVFHFGINIDPFGAPIDAIGLKDLKVDPEELAKEVLSSYEHECFTVEVALRKVRRAD